MASTEDFGERLESIERHLAELDHAVQRTPTYPVPDPLERISPTAWLKVTGPVFAVMALGFGLLLNGQRTLGSNMLALQDSTHAQLIGLTRPPRGSRRPPSGSKALSRVSTPRCKSCATRCGGCCRTTACR